MLFYRCKCGESTAWGSMPPDRCYACPTCGSSLATGPDLHSDPLPHDFSRATSEERGIDGPVKVPVCVYCGKAEWEIKASGSPESKEKQP